MPCGVPAKGWAARCSVLFFLPAALSVPAGSQCPSDIFRKRIRAQIVNDPFVPGMKLILFVEAGLLLFGLELFVYFSLSFIATNL